MSEKKRKNGFGTRTSLPSSLRENLGLSSTGKKGKKMKSRKELRKEARDEKKRNHVTKKWNHDEKLTAGKKKLETSSQSTEVQSIPTKGTSNISQSSSTTNEKKKRKILNPVISNTPINDPEDEEIARLEKLLGITGKGSKKKAAEKLNKEYEMYEGITGNFGDFLMQLDDLTNSIQKGTYNGVFKNEGGSDDEFDDQFTPHILDDSEQEGSDIDDGDHDGESESDDEDEDQISDALPEESEGSENEDDDGDGDDYQSEESSQEETEITEKLPAFVYRPTQGEDIYGRPLNQSGNEGSSGKYVPPARRQQQQQQVLTSNPSSVIDESSDTFKLLKRQLNGQLNRLSEQTRDSVLKSISDLFRGNSLTILSHILRQYIFSVCGNPSQLMESLVPLYASLVAALHISVHHDIGSSLLEILALKLVENLKNAAGNQAPTSEHALISDKTSTNIMLFIVYLYNLRVVHHRLIMDILEYLVTPLASQPQQSVFSPLRVELILCVVEHCGPTLRSDDPQGLKNFIVKLNGLSASHNSDTSTTKDSHFDGRLQFMINCISDLKNNKSRRTQNTHTEAVVAMRKWLGRVKSSKIDKGSDGCLTMSLQDLLQADTVGRWWRAGASWIGREQSNQQQEKQRKSLPNSSLNEEEEVLLKLANKFHMNTSVKRDIFVVVMSSRDATDAYERLSRLDLRGKQDREIIRVITTICGLEATYNEFYSELLTLYCAENRQNRTTLQYVYWDFFKLLSNENPSDSIEGKNLDRKAINMARLLANMVTQFYLSLSILKVIDISALTSHMMLFLATFFLALFSTKISDSTFASVLDRIATTSDCLLVRENVMFFLQKHLEEFPAGLPHDELKLMKKRRKQTLQTLDSMSVLDIAQGLKDKEEKKSKKRKGSFDGSEEESD